MLNKFDLNKLIIFLIFEHFRAPLIKMILLEVNSFEKEYNILK
jgi:hypothetical protein